VKLNRNFVGRGNIRISGRACVMGSHKFRLGGYALQTCLLQPKRVRSEASKLHICLIYTDCWTSSFIRICLSTAESRHLPQRISHPLSMAASAPVVGLYGLAVMGQNLALNIADKGFPIAVCNRSPEKVRVLGKGQLI